MNKKLLIALIFCVLTSFVSCFSFDKLFDVFVTTTFFKHNFENFILKFLVITNFSFLMISTIISLFMLINNFKEGVK